MVIDIGMPVEDGFAFLKRIRAYAYAAGAPSTQLSTSVPSATTVLLNAALGTARTSSEIIRRSTPPTW